MAISGNFEHEETPNEREARVSYLTVMDIDANSGMEGGQKTLAAIVFTDVVGFANHANRDERRALSALHRDISIMEDVCARTSGTVLKTMGDGVLMRFPSANQALVCALEVQRIFHEQSKRIDPLDMLWHRIGVHLGDVITTANDVYGDGVNVAARLQAEAKPGSIYLSRTVYDVVKGKMKIPAVYVGPRHLKGISEPVSVWEVPALANQEQERRHRALDALNPSPTMDGSGGSVRTPKAVFTIIASVLLLLVSGAALVIGIKRGADAKMDERGKQTRLNRHHSANAKLGDSSATTGVASPTGVDAANETDPLADTELFAKLKPLFEADDFDGMVAAVQSSKYASTTKGMALADRYTKYNEFYGWFDTQLASTSPDHRVSVQDDPELHVPIDVYRTSPGQVSIRTSSATSLKEISQLSKAQVAAIALSLLDRAGATDNITRPDLDREIRHLNEDANRFGKS